MTEYDNRNKGALFRNESTNERAPAYTGPFTGPNNEDMQIKAWLRKTKDGRTYMSVVVEEKYVPEHQAQQPAQQPAAQALDDDIPF